MEDETLEIPPKVRIRHELPEEDIIEHVASMNCLCEPTVSEWIDMGDAGSVVVVKHPTFESTKPKSHPFMGWFGGFGWPDMDEDS